MEKWTSNYCSQNEEDEYVYPDEKWTENQPPQGIILPCYYDLMKQWVGQTQDELERCCRKWKFLLMTKILL